MMETFISKDHPPPDEFEKYTKLLIITLWKGGYPHEIIVCIFNKCFSEVVEAAVENEEGPQDVRERRLWPPKRIVGELSDVSLIELYEKLKQDYIADSALPKELVNDCFHLLGVKMGKKVSETINPFDKNARKRWARISDKLVSKTTFRDYYGENPEDNIADWSYRVLQRVKKFIVENNWFERPIEELLKELFENREMSHENFA